MKKTLFLTFLATMQITDVAFANSDIQASVTPSISISFDVPKGKPDLQCSDSYGTYFLFNLKDLRNIKIVERRAGALLAVPHLVENATLVNNGVTLDSTFNSGVLVEKSKILFDSATKTLQVSSLKSGKTYNIPCEKSK